MSKNINRGLTFKKAQMMNESVYGIQNSRFYSARSMSVKIGCYIGIMIKAKRKNDPQRFQQGVILAFSWMMALANKLRIVDVGDEVFRRFPGHCPYCSSSPCACGQERPLNRQTVGLTTPIHSNINSFQGMFGEIYGAVNSFDSTSQHLAEEAFELAEQIDAFEARHSSVEFEEVLIEYVDVIANLFAVMNSAPKDFSFDIELRFQELFKDGCYWCKNPECQCGFTVLAETTTKRK